MDKIIAETWLCIITLEDWKDMLDCQHSCMEFEVAPEDFIEGEEVECDECEMTGHTFRSNGFSETLTIIWDDE